MTGSASRPVTLAGQYVCAIVTDQVAAASRVYEAIGRADGWDAVALFVAFTLGAVARERLGPEPPVADLTAFVVRRTATARPGVVNVHDTETLLRYALGEDVNIEGITQTTDLRLFLLRGLVKEANFPPEAIAEIVVMVERAFARNGRPLAPAPGSDRRD